MSVSKKDLSNSLKNELNLTVEESSIFVDEFFNSLAKALNANEVVKISGFGTFRKFLTKSRVGRNPNTMEVFSIPPKEKVKFWLSDKAKKMLN